LCFGITLYPKKNHHHYNTKKQKEEEEEDNIIKQVDYHFYPLVSESKRIASKSWVANRSLFR
jgi:hypothetical protein